MDTLMMMSSINNNNFGKKMRFQFIVCWDRFYANVRCLLLSLRNSVDGLHRFFIPTSTENNCCLMCTNLHTKQSFFLVSTHLIWAHEIKLPNISDNANRNSVMKSGERALLSLSFSSFHIFDVNISCYTEHDSGGIQNILGQFPIERDWLRVCLQRTSLIIQCTLNL